MTFCILGGNGDLFIRLIGLIADSYIHPETLLVWLKKQIALYDITITDVTSSFQNGLALCAIINRYRPDLLDFASLDPANVAGNNQLAFDILEELGVPPVKFLVLLLSHEECQSSPDTNYHDDNFFFLR